jgi:hypothetical protein
VPQGPDRVWQIPVAPALISRLAWHGLVSGEKTTFQKFDGHQGFSAWAISTIRPMRLTGEMRPLAARFHP